jgi:hypothetical protein
MAIHNIQTWRITLDDVSPWTASAFLLDSLVGYAAAVDDTAFVDREQVHNALIAWRLASPARKLRQITGPAPILEARLNAAEWRNRFAKLTATAAAELVVENFISDPSCGFGDAVTVIAPALEAWGEAQLPNHKHKLGGRSDKSKLPA